MAKLYSGNEGWFNKKNKPGFGSFSAIPGFGADKCELNYNQVLVKVRV